MSVPSSYFYPSFSSQPSYVCQVDVTPPTFAGISSLVANANGSLQASWAAGSALQPPINYRVYVQANTAVGLFALNPSVITYGTTAAIWLDSIGNLLQNGVTYYVGVRATDAVGNMETNTVSLSAVSQGVPSTSIMNELILIQQLVTAGL